MCGVDILNSGITSRGDERGDRGDLKRGLLTGSRKKKSKITQNGILQCLVGTSELAKTS